MREFRFLNWNVYKESKKLFSLILLIVRKLPPQHRYDIGTQFTRASMSITLNIAEGSGKNSDKELNHFFNIALGSTFEVLALSDLLLENKFIDEKTYQKILNTNEYKVHSIWHNDKIKTR